MRTLLAAFTVTILIATATASADLLAYEGFAGYDPADLDGQSTSSTVGFDGSDAWSVSGDNSSSDGWSAQATTLGYGALVTSDGAAQAERWSSWTGDTEGADARLEPGSPYQSTEMTEAYFSFLIDADSLSNAHSFVVGWDHDVRSNVNAIGVEIRGAGDVYALSRDFSEDTGLQLSAGVNLVVVRATQGTAGDGSDEYDVWLNPDLTAPGAAQYSAPVSFNDGLVGEANPLDFIAGVDGFDMNGTFIGENLVVVDELRVGETFADVTPIPEPATMSLLALGGLAMLRRRRR